MKNLKNTPKFIGAVILGAIAGTALGLLLAPNKGTKTRDKIAGNAKRIAQELNKKFTNEVNNLKNKAEKLEKKAEEKLIAFEKNVEEKTKNLLHFQ